MKKTDGSDRMAATLWNQAQNISSTLPFRQYPDQHFFDRDLICAKISAEIICSLSLLCPLARRHAL